MGGEILVRRMTNAIRPDGAASLLAKDEAQPCAGAPAQKRLPLRGSVAKRVTGAMGWLATERDQRPLHVKQGDLGRERAVFMLGREPKSCAPQESERP